MSSGKTGIEWTDATWNPVVGCTPVSPGCLNCYAATMARRLEAMGVKEYQPLQRDIDGRDVTGTPGLQDDDNDRICRIAEVKAGRAVFTGDVRTVEARLTEPLRRKKPTMWFVNSMSDLFHEAVPFAFIDKVFAVMALCPRHTFQVLTKRPERMAEYMTRREISRAWTPSVRCGDGGSDSAKWKTPCDNVYTIARQMKGRDAAPELIWPLRNVWLGTSVEDQARADERIPHLLKCPAAVRFLSCEPLLGPVDLKRYMAAAAYRVLQKTHPCDESRVPDHLRYNGPPSPDWVIVGGESGPGARPTNIAWHRSIRDQCKAAGVPFFEKQLGSNVEIRNDEVLDWLDEVGMGLDYVETEHARMQGDPVRVLLNDRKGGDPSEWPEDLRVRQMPERDCPPPF